MEMVLEIISFVSFMACKPSVAVVFSNLSSLRAQEKKLIFEFLQITSCQRANNCTFPCLTSPWGQLSEGRRFEISRIVFPWHCATSKHMGSCLNWRERRTKGCHCGLGVKQ